MLAQQDLAELLRHLQHFHQLAPKEYHSLGLCLAGSWLGILLITGSRLLQGFLALMKDREHDVRLLSWYGMAG